jgi:hypothetical protein
MAEPTGLEPATSRVTGERSNQLNYDSAVLKRDRRVLEFFGYVKPWGLLLVSSMTFRILTV